MELMLAPSVSVRLAHPSVETMFFPACRPVTCDVNSDSAPHLTGDEFVQYLFHELFDEGGWTLTSRHNDI